MLARISLQARSSRARIKLLDNAEESPRERLLHVFAHLEQRIEGTVLDMMDETPPGAATPVEDGGPSPPSSSATVAATAEPKDGDAVAVGSDKPGTEPSKTTSSPTQPQLTAAQLQMVSSLNRLPNLKKQLAFIDPIRNSHATIVCRDVANFEFHRRGEGVLRHWADHFVL